MNFYKDIVVNQYMQLVKNFTVELVYTDGTSAPVYNEDGTAKANPFAGSSDGTFEFWTDPGTYLIRVSGPTITSLEQQLFIPAATQTATADTGDIPPGAEVLITIPWPSAYPNTNYTPSASIQDNGPASAAGLRVVHIEQILPGAIAVRVVNDDGDNTRQGLVIAYAVS